MSVTGISAKRAPGTSTRSVCGSVDAGEALASGRAVVGLSSEASGADTEAACLEETVEDDPVAAAVFLVGALASDLALDLDEPVFETAARVAEPSEASLPASAGAETDSGSGAFRASGKNRSTGRDGEAPAPWTPAEAELGIAQALAVFQEF